MPTQCMRLHATTTLRPALSLENDRGMKLGDPKIVGRICTVFAIFYGFLAIAAFAMRDWWAVATFIGATLFFCWMAWRAFTGRLKDS
jgi:hypothetical protein